MLPCQQNCPRYAPGCHKTCSQRKEFQHQQDFQRQQKKSYLKYYNELCAVRTRQLRILSPVWWGPSRWQKQRRPVSPDGVVSKEKRAKM